MKVAHALLDGLIDYAGLFPPASLDMPSAVRAYAEYKTGADREWLGRFILPVSRLDEFAGASQELLGAGIKCWHLSAIGGGDPTATRKTVEQFNDEFAGSERVLCDAIEMPVITPDDISLAVETVPESFDLFLEIPLQPDPSSLIAAIAGTHASAKLRTGGVVASAIPSPSDVLRFVRACSENRVPFKATAGLHHALRGDYALTYEADAPNGTMHGYLNLFLAAAFADDGMDDAQLLRLLTETDASAFRFDESGAHWRSSSVDLDKLIKVRRELAISFGSCSFVEPVSEAKELNLL